MCGIDDVIKKDGTYVCKICGDVMGDKFREQVKKHCSPKILAKFDKQIKDTKGD